jgi:hypothetical protein
MIIVTSEKIFRNIHILNPQLIVCKKAKRIDKARLAVAD